MADTFENLTEFETGIHCSPLVYRGSHITVEGYQVGQIVNP